MMHLLAGCVKLLNISVALFTSSTMSGFLSISQYFMLCSRQLKHMGFVIASLHNTHSALFVCGVISTTSLLFFMALSGSSKL